MTPTRLLLALLVLPLAAPAAAAVEFAYGDLLYVSVVPSSTPPGLDIVARVDGREVTLGYENAFTLTRPHACGHGSAEAPLRPLGPRGCIDGVLFPDPGECIGMRAEGEETDSRSLLYTMGGGAEASVCGPAASACAVDQGGNDIACIVRYNEGRSLCVAGFLAPWEAPRTPLGPACLTP